MNSPLLSSRALRAAHQEHALIPPVDHVGELPAVRTGCLQELDQRDAVNELGHGQNLCRELPLAQWQPDRWHDAHGGSPVAWVVRLVGLVRILVWVVFKSEAHLGRL